MKSFIFLYEEDWERIIYVLSRQEVLSGDDELDDVDNIIRKIKEQTGLR